MGTVLGGLAIHSCITLPILFVLVARRNPFAYSYNMLQAYLTAFGTASR
jgi:Na+/H+-dicarboxylate symporter